MRHGIQAITCGAGQNDVHTVDEHVNVADYLDGCKLALALAVLPSEDKPVREIAVCSGGIFLADSLRVGFRLLWRRRLANPTRERATVPRSRVGLVQGNATPTAKPPISLEVQVPVVEFCSAK